MPILVDYRCASCGTQSEQLARQPVPSESTCSACGALARRRFSAAALLAKTSTSEAPAAPVGNHSCADHRGVPGSCTLTPAASRMLTARASNDQRAVERELARQETAIAAGTLDPEAPVTTASPAHQSTHPSTRGTPK